MEENNFHIAEEEIYNSKNGKGFKKIFKNFSFLTLGKIGGDLFTLVLFIVLSRKFGREGIGEYSFAVALTGIFAVCSDFGLYNYTIKEISKNKDTFKSHFSQVLSLRVVQSVVVYIILLAILSVLSFSVQSKLIIAIIGAYQIVYSFIEGISAVFIAHEHMHISAGIEASLKIITSLAAVSITFMGGGIVISLLALPFLATIQLFIVRLLLIKRIGRTELSFSYNFLKNTFKHAVPYGTSDFLWQLYARIDVVLIGFMLGESLAGVYNVGYRVVFFLFFISKFASIALFPIASRLFHESKHEFRKMYNKSLNMIIMISLPISAGLMLIAPKVIGLVFGQDFDESSIILKILSFLFLTTFLSSIMEIFLMSSDRQVRRAKSQWNATWINMTLNVLLIISYGIVGAAIAVLISSFVLVLFYIFELKAVIGVPNIKSRLGISLLGVMAFYLPLTLLNYTSLFLVIPAAIIIYISVALAFKDVRRTELRMVLSLLSASK